MSPWVRLLGLFAAAAAAALLLKGLHPLIVFTLFVGGVAYANHVLTVKPRRERTRSVADLLGLRPAPDQRASIAAQPFALLGRPQADVRDVMAGSWRGIQVHLFDLESTSSVPVPGSDGVRRDSCVLAPLPLETSHLIAEPRAFLTPEADRPPLPVCDVDDPRIADAFDVRCEDLAFGVPFLRGPVGEWLVAQREQIAFETSGPTALLYGPAVPVKDREGLLEALGGFLDAVATWRSSVEP